MSLTRAASPSGLLYAAAGSPAVSGVRAMAPFRCWICAAESSRGVDRYRWQGDNFTGQTHARCPDSIFVCEPCVYTMAGRPPDTLRMYSHLVDDRGWLKLNKGDKPKIRDWLRSAKCGAWFAAIADSGQKHIVPWCAVNPAGTRRGAVRFEEDDVTIPVDHAAGWTLIDRMTALLTAGASKDEVARGTYGSFAWSACPTAITSFEENWSGKRGTGWFALALWLAQRDEEEVAARRADKKMIAVAKKEKQSRGKTRRQDGGETANAHGGGGARSAGIVPQHKRREPSQALGSNPGPDAGSSAHDDESRGMGDVDRENTSITGAVGEQLSIFEGPRRRGD